MQVVPGVGPLWLELGDQVEPRVVVEAEASALLPQRDAARGERHSLGLVGGGHLNEVSPRRGPVVTARGNVRARLEAGAGASLLGKAARQEHESCPQQS